MYVFCHRPFTARRARRSFRLTLWSGPSTFWRGKLPAIQSQRTALAKTDISGVAITSIITSITLLSVIVVSHDLKIYQEYIHIIHTHTHIYIYIFPYAVLVDSAVTGPLCHWNARRVASSMVFSWTAPAGVMTSRSSTKARVAHQRPVKGEGMWRESFRWFIVIYRDLSWFIVIYCDLDRFINDLSI